MSCRSSRGAALLSAMLLVTLVATLSATAIWQQWRSTEVERAERLRIQSVWLLQGATDWARLILREDARSDATDHLAEPWAVPLEEAKISTFLGASAEADGAMGALGALGEASLSGDITDLQSRFNLRNLVQNGRPHGPAVRILARLFDALRLPPQELDILVRRMTQALESADASPASDIHPLLPFSAEPWEWLGLSGATARALQPYVVVLPEPTPVNLNTAPPPVLQACLEGLDAAGVQQLVRVRAHNHFRTLAEVTQAAGPAKPLTQDAQHSVGSRYFAVRARLRLDGLVTELRTVLRRDGLEVNTLAQTREVPPGRSLQ